MIITKTPFRMSFFGGGTDMESFFRTRHGAVLSTTFDKYCFVTVRPLPHFYDYSTHLTYSKNEYVNRNNEIQHPLIRNAMELLDIHDIRMTYDEDLPARSGLGTSSSFAVGLLHALYTLKGQQPDKKMLADKAIYLERSLCGETGGWQDQIAASFGGLNRINFFGDRYEVLPLKLTEQRKQKLNDRLMLFFTGFTRVSGVVQRKNRLSDTTAEHRLLQMYELVDRAEIILTDPDCNLDAFGCLLHENWKMKRSLGPAITTPEIDSLYRRALSAGALGGKLLGAGGGGFLLFYVPTDRQPAVRQALNGLMEIPFSFENKGSQLIFSDIRNDNPNQTEGTP